MDTYNEINTRLATIGWDIPNPKDADIHVIYLKHKDFMVARSEGRLDDARVIMVDMVSYGIRCIHTHDVNNFTTWSIGCPMTKKVYNYVVRDQGFQMQDRGQLVYNDERTEMSVEECSDCFCERVCKAKEKPSLATVCRVVLMGMKYLICN